MRPERLIITFFAVVVAVLVASLMTGGEEKSIPEPTTWTVTFYPPTGEPIVWEGVTRVFAADRTLVTFMTADGQTVRLRGSLIVTEDARTGSTSATSTSTSRTARG